MLQKGLAVSIERGLPSEVDDEVRPTTTYYEVVDIVHGRNRPHMVPSRHRDTHIVTTSSLAVHVQHYAVWDQFTDDEVTVFPDVDCEWFDGLELFRDHARCLAMRKWTMGDSTTRACFEFTNPVVLATTIPLLDVGCPTLVLREEMNRRGWRPIQNRVVHDSSDIVIAGVPYDGRSLIQHRF